MAKVVTPLISLELNELNFDYVAYYVNRGQLPNFAKLFKQFKTYETTSETDYTSLEPWIQWPTVYTGKTFAEHKIFRLGDVLLNDHAQIWDELEKRSLKVGAISPMNAANRCLKPAFFVPDPWTETSLTGDKGLEALFPLIRRLVNANAAGDISLAMVVRLIVLSMGNIRLTSMLDYVKLVWLSRRARWSRAIVLDRLLADIFIRNWKRHRPDYSSLFLNAAAHIQHHHLFQSAACRSLAKTPRWSEEVADGGPDPVLAVYQTYDRVLRDVVRLPGIRLFLTTGLSQIANAREIHQYRPKDHAAFIAQIGVLKARAHPRMSRDFLLDFECAEDARLAEARLGLVTRQGERFFECENRGDTLFCKICYFGPPSGLSEVMVGNHPLDVSQMLTLVTIENGIHQSTGYHVDTGHPVVSAEYDKTMALSSIFAKTMAAFN